MTYRIVLKTLLGKKYGRLTLYESGNMLTGFLEILGHRTEIQDGETADGQCRFSGEFITPVRNIRFNAEGSADNKGISLNVKAGLLDLSISGEAETDQNE